MVSVWCIKKGNAGYDYPWLICTAFALSHFSQLHLFADNSARIESIYLFCLEGGKESYDLQSHRTHDREYAIARRKCDEEK
jgi:hypothetical protein